jgi:myosin heavy subunit
VYLWRANKDCTSYDKYRLKDLQVASRADLCDSVLHAEADDADGEPVSIKGVLRDFLPFDEESTDSLLRMDDLTQLQRINVPSIVECLQRRFKQGKMYTFIGNTLISINPREVLDIVLPDTTSKVKLYDSTVRKYFADNSCEGKVANGHRAHIFSVAERAYRSLKDTQTNQSIVISGESGSGKTECAKYSLEYIIEVCRNQAEDDRTEALLRHILVHNKILEAFGNAKTFYNENSSRFGKFLKLYFQPDCERLIGVQIETYLLEKSRLVECEKGERNFHVFYQMLAGMAKVSELKLRPKESYVYLSGRHSQCEFDITYSSGKDDYGMWEELRDALYEMQLSEDQVFSIAKTLSAVLLLGNIKFYDVYKEYNNYAEVKRECETDLQDVADLLDVDAKRLKRILTYKDDYISMSSPQAENNRDTLAKTIYNNLFDFLCNQINMVLKQGIENRSDFDTAKYVGLLDIFGFENFRDDQGASVNSLEQFCINLANEKLQVCAFDFL